jgi:hypothetical protein
MRQLQMTFLLLHLLLLGNHYLFALLIYSFSHLISFSGPLSEVFSLQELFLLHYHHFVLLLLVLISIFQPQPLQRQQPPLEL